MTYESGAAVEDAFCSGRLAEADLKAALTKAIDALLEPARPSGALVSRTLVRSQGERKRAVTPAS